MSVQKRFPAPRSLNVLVVDDDGELCELMALRAGSLGHRVSATASLHGTLQALATTPADVVLLDLDLGTEHGFEVLDALARRWPELPVVVLTASGTVETEQEALRRGAYAFVTKPFHHRELMQLLARAAQSRGVPVDGARGA